MVVGLLLCLRVVVASLLIVAAASKLARWPWSADLMWRPSKASDELVRVVVLVLSLWELVFALLIAVNAFGGLWLVALASVTFGALSAYGIRAVAATGTCGCTGGDEPSSAKALLQRNAALFAAIALCCFAGPRLAEAPSTTASLAFLPMALFAIGLLFRLIQRVRRREPALGLERRAAVVGE